MLGYVSQQTSINSKDFKQLRITCKYSFTYPVSLARISKLGNVTSDIMRNNNYS